MKTVVITGSTRGLGFEMARVFRSRGFNVVLSGTNTENLDKAEKELRRITGSGALAGKVCNVSSIGELQGLWDYAVNRFGAVDIWINNAGVNQPDKAVWELSEEEIGHVLNVDLCGTVYGCKVAMNGMKLQGHGAIYNMEGHGSNDAVIKGLSIYGTSKRAVTYFTGALAKESEEMKTGIIVGKLSPGIMITDFINRPLNMENRMELSEKTKRIYNILGDYPDVVARFLVDGMLRNTRNDARIEWLTGRKAAWRFLTAAFNKRDFFKEITPHP